MTLWTPELLTGQPTKVGLLQHYVGGSFVDSPGRFAKVSPVTGEQIFEVCEADESTVDAAVEAARNALKGPWGRMGEQERANVLRRVADELERRFEDLVAAEVGDTGKSISQARTLDIPAVQPTSAPSRTSRPPSQPSPTRPRWLTDAARSTTRSANRSVS